MKSAWNFFRESIDEFKKVQWPTKKEAFKLTMVVVATSLLSGVFIESLDFIFREALAKFISLS